MSLRQLSLTNFRNLQSNTLDFDAGLNLISGSNASGKTSLLEAINVICQGKSFRSQRLQDCIQHDKDSFLVFGYFTGYKSGVARNKTETRIKVNEERVYRLSGLAELTPVKIANPDSVRLITGSPALKREYIDWCLFHVEHKYKDLWSKYRHALKQRNALLRVNKDIEQLDYWDDYLCRYSEEIYQYRRKYLDQISETITHELITIVGDIDFSFDYICGWNRDKALIDIFKTNRRKDILHGYTQYGSHRDNIEFRSNGYLSKDELSRGQQKRLTMAMILAQTILVKKQTNKSVILMIDDIDSELDTEALKKVIDKLTELKHQLFITQINESISGYLDQQEYKMFHVEHGMIRPVKNS